MRKKNGMTLIEMLISMLIVSIVIALLFNMLIKVRDEELAHQIQSTYLINQASIIKQVEEDILDYGVKRVSSCSLSDVNIKSGAIDSKYRNKYYCVRFDYNANFIEENTAFLMLYKSSEDEVNEDIISGRWILQYVRGKYTEYDYVAGVFKKESWVKQSQLMKQYPFDIKIEDKSYASFTASGDKTNAVSVVLPIKDPKGLHYDINLSFTYKPNELFKCKTTNQKMFECDCLSKDETFCNRVKTD